MLLLRTPTLTPQNASLKQHSRRNDSRYPRACQRERKKEKGKGVRGRDREREKQKGVKGGHWIRWMTFSLHLSIVLNHTPCISHFLIFKNRNPSSCLCWVKQFSLNITSRHTYELWPPIFNNSPKNVIHGRKCHNKHLNTIEAKTSVTCSGASTNSSCPSRLVLH